MASWLGWRCVMPMPLQGLLILWQQRLRYAVPFSVAQRLWSAWKVAGKSPPGAFRCKK
jgi:hypothetical protein